MEKKRCPLCKKILYKRHKGLVCKNHQCGLYHKLGQGWVFLDGSKKNNLQYFKDKYDFDIERFENKKKWLLLKTKIFMLRGRKCEICGGLIELNIHHIIPRTESPELTFDEENLIILCIKCHKKIHSQDKHRFG